MVESDQDRRKAPSKSKTSCETRRSFSRTTTRTKHHRHFTNGMMNQTNKQQAQLNANGMSLVCSTTSRTKRNENQKRSTRNARLRNQLINHFVGRAFLDVKTRKIHPNTNTKPIERLVSCGNGLHSKEGNKTAMRSMHPFLPFGSFASHVMRSHTARGCTTQHAA